MAAWLDTFTGVLAMATEADLGEISVDTESLTAVEVSPNTAAGMLFTSGIPIILVFLTFHLLLTSK